jgi:bacillithiol biosynthesis cysteine-adding enzyme BshC
MECSCVRFSDVPGTSKIFSDLIYHFDRVADLYPFAPNSFESLVEASQVDFPADRRAAIVAALTPLNEGNPSLRKLAEPNTVAVVTGQQVGLFSGPAYTVYKALSAIKAARSLTDRGTPAVPVFWLATEDHDFAEVDHVWMFGADNRPVKIRMPGPEENGTHPVGGIALRDIPIAELKATLAGLPFADEAAGIIERAYRPGETMGSAFGKVIKELFGSYGLLLIDPMDPAIRKIAAPLMRQAVEHMPELIDAVIARSKELVDRGYHAQVLANQQTSLAFLLEDGKRYSLHRKNSHFEASHRKFTTAELADHAAELSPNALLRPVIQDYLLPTAAYIGGPAELAYLAQSAMIYQGLAQRQPAAFPRSSFTVVDQRSQKQMAKYNLTPPDLFVREQLLHDKIAGKLVPPTLRASLDKTQQSFQSALDSLKAELQAFDVTLASAMETSRKKIEFQVGKIARKTANQIMARDEQATRNAASLSGLAFPESHLQERLYSIIPLIAKFGPGLIDELYSAIQIECPDHQFAVV